MLQLTNVVYVNCLLCGNLAGFHHTPAPLLLATIITEMSLSNTCSLDTIGRNAGTAGGAEAASAAPESILQVYAHCCLHLAGSCGAASRRASGIALYLDLHHTVWVAVPASLCVSVPWPCKRFNVIKLQRVSPNPILVKRMNQRRQGLCHLRATLVQSFLLCASTLVRRAVSTGLTAAEWVASWTDLQNFAFKAGVAYSYRDPKGQTVFRDLVQQWPGLATSSNKVPSLLVYDKKCAFPVHAQFRLWTMEYLCTIHAEALLSF